MSTLQPTPTTYTLVIDEDQRKLILAALQLLPPHLSGLLDSVLAGTDQEVRLEVAQEETTLLVGMLTDLPQVEAGEPGIIHGLCY